MASLDNAHAHHSLKKLLIAYPHARDVHCEIPYKFRVFLGIERDSQLNHSPWRDRTWEG